LLHRVQSSDFQLLGFQSEVSFTHHGRHFGLGLNDCAVKTYEHKGSKAVGAESPLAHPKTESVLLGYFPAPAFDSLVEVSTTILHAFLAWAGVESQDLIEDEFYSPKDRPPVTTPVPTEYVEGLMSYYESESLRNTLIGELFHRKTMSKFDIVATLLFWSNHTKHGSTGITYRALSEKTGLAQETLRKHVRELENLGVVKRIRGGRTFISVSRVTRDILRKLVLPSAQTIGDVLSKVKKRASIRRAHREGSSSDEVADSTSDDAVSDQIRVAGENWQYLVQTEYSPEDIVEMIRAGRLSPDDILVRR
jgi:DNA-binding Lrp family transcriptional regulator